VLDECEESQKVSINLCPNQRRNVTLADANAGKGRRPVDIRGF